MGIELFVLFPYYLFNVCWVCSGIPSFIHDAGNLFSPFLWTEKCLFFLLCQFLFIYMYKLFTCNIVLICWDLSAILCSLCSFCFSLIFPIFLGVLEHFVTIPFKFIYNVYKYISILFKVVILHLHK